MKDRAIIYVPSDTPEALAMAPRKVAAVPLIVRGIMALAEAGIGACTLLIAKPQQERIEKFLSRYREERLPEIDIVTYDEPYRVSPSIVDTIGETLQKRTLLINANLLFEKKLVETIYEHDADDDRLFICKEGVHSLPIMEVTREAWRGLAQFTLEAPRSIESCINYLLENYPHREIQKPADVNTFLLRRREDIPVAEKFLSEAIRRSTNGPVAKYINKRFSLPVAMILTKLWISPHAVTSINIVIGLLSGVFLAGGDYYSMLIGASLFQVASVADGVDGEIAKLSFRSSKFGQYIDTISDNLALASALIGMTVGSYRAFQSDWVLVSGGIAVAGIATIVWMMARFLKRNTNSASLVTFDKEYLQKRSSSDHPIIMTFLRYCKHVAKKDIFSFMIFGWAVAGLLQYWIFFIAFGAVLGAIALVYLEVADSAKARTTSTWKDGIVPFLKSKKMFVFDFDGTLVDSMEQFADIASQVMAKYYNIKPAEARASYFRTSGIPFFQQLETLFPGNPNNAKAADEYEHIKKQSYFDRPVFSDAAKAIKELQKRNVKVAVSSNNFQELVDEFVTRKGLKFDETLGFRENFAKGEDHFRFIEQKHGIKRDEIAFVGDSIKDGERAKTSNVTFIGKEGIFTKKEFKQHFPDAQVISTLEELKKLL